MRKFVVIAVAHSLVTVASAQAPSFSQHASSPVAVSAPMRDIEIVDLNSDGKGDVVVTTVTGPDIEVFMQSGAGSFSSPGTGYANYTWWMTDVDAVDVDGDGDPDLVGYQPLADFTASDPDPDEAIVVTWLNSSGSLSEQPFVEVGDDNSFGRILGFDFDGDGDEDLGRVNAGTLHLLENDAFSGYSSESASGSSYGPSYNLAGGDVDRDGDIDVLLKLNHQVGITLNGGTGAFTDDSTVDHGLGDNPSLAVGDLGEDGYVDCVVADGMGCNVGLNVGAGAFNEVGFTSLLPPGIFNNPTISFEDIRLADVDGDFLLDLVSGSSNQAESGAITAYGVIAMGTDSGGFDNVATFQGTTQNPPFGNSHVLGVAVGDLDGDLWTDFVHLENNTLAGPRFRAYINGSTAGWQDLGYALPGVAGPPDFSASGSLASSFTLTLKYSVPSTAQAYILLGTSRYLPPDTFHGGYLVPVPLGSPYGATQVNTNSSGGFSYSATGSSVSGVNFFLQVWVVDSAGPDGFAASNAIVQIIP
jgi:hypothetical protein